MERAKIITNGNVNLQNVNNQMEDKIKQLIAELEEREKYCLKASKNALNVITSVKYSALHLENQLLVVRLNNILKGE